MIDTTVQAPAVETVQPAPPSPIVVAEPFAFEGTAREYFRIWVVNLFLSIVTLGIYSAWAKVRKKRYFYNNTWLAGANFDYHGEPLAILKGRLIAAAGLLAYKLTFGVWPRVSTWVSLAFLLVLPWLIVRSLQFNAVSSSYRHLRFHFRGSYFKALLAVSPLLLVPIITLALPVASASDPSTSSLATMFLPLLPLVALYPYVVGALKRLHTNGASYGDTRFEFGAKTGAYYRIYVLLPLLFIGSLFAMVPVLLVLVLTRQNDFLMPAMYLLYIVTGATLLAYTRSRVINLSFNQTTLSGARFVSSVSFVALAKLYLVNLIAISASLGLLIPWATIRAARYRASCLRIECESGFETFVSAVAKPVGATGDELGEFFDVDLSI